MSTKEEWKTLAAELDAIERERESISRPAREAYEAEMKRLFAPTKDRHDALKERIDEIEGEIGSPVNFCEGCGSPIWEGDKHHTGYDSSLCETCAPTWGDMLQSSANFQALGDDGDYRPMTKEDAAAAVNAHLAAGGSLDDKMVSA